MKKIISYIDDMELYDWAHMPTLNALRAVAELHKPIVTYKTKNGINPDYECCVDCGLQYPCKTIQAIEKELQ